MEKTAGIITNDGLILKAIKKSNRLESENAALREVLKELIPIASEVSDIYIQGYKAGQVKDIVDKASKLIKT